jgi:hypothetical protein
MAPLSLIRCSFDPHLVGGSQLMNDSKFTKINIDLLGLLCVGESCYHWLLIICKKKKKKRKASYSNES